ncbi:MAG: FAD binding domain-containing protein [Candidatus Heimdallarchaeaceae archaeon]
MKFILNQRIVEIDEPLGKPTLDFLRSIGVKGVKEACHTGDCGACMILLGELKNDTVTYRATTSCILPLGEIAGKHVVTIEGLNQEKLNPIQQALVDKGGSQCGFCTPGFVISLTGYFLNEHFDKIDILSSIEGNICRCGAYASIIRAAQELEKTIKIEENSLKNRIDILIEAKVLPPYFSSIPEKLKELKEWSVLNSKEKGTYVAGGTDLLVQHKSIADPIFLSNKKFRGIWLEDNFIYIGASTSTEEIRLSDELNTLLDIQNHLSLVSSLPIRQQASLGGNIVNASPIGDLTIYFLALDAEIGLLKNGNRRTIKLRDFYKGYKILDLEEGELVEWLRIRNEKRLFNFEKVAKRRYDDIASVNSAISLKMDGKRIIEGHLSAGGVAPVPKYLEESSKFLENKEISAHLIQEVKEVIDTEISPIDDVRGSAKYKRLLLKQLVVAHFVSLFPELEVEL